MTPYEALYACLSVNYNFHNFIKMEESLWQGWCIGLEPDVKHIPEAIKLINNGHLNEIIGKSAIPTLQHLKTLIKGIRRLSTLDSKTEYNSLQLENKAEKLTKEEIAAMIDRAKTTAKRGHQAFDPKR